MPMQNSTFSTPSYPDNRPATRGVFAGVSVILGVCVVAVAFLLWLLYIHHPPVYYRHRLLFLPALNAILNGCAAVALTTGFICIRSRQVARHRAAMMTAFVFSAAFLVSYILNHALHGDTYYPGHSSARTFYLWMLASHIILSVVALPLVLVTFFFSLSGRIAQHRRIARFTFPLWLYVSLTGVAVYLMLHAAVGAAY